MHPAIHKETGQSTSQTENKLKKKLKKVSPYNLGPNAFCIKEHDGSTLIQAEDYAINYLCDYTS